MLLSFDSLAPQISGLSGQQYVDMAASGTLQGDLKLLIGIANGEYVRKATTVRRAELALTRLLAYMRSADAMRAADFWQTEPGILISRVRWWISVDDLVTIGNAAALAFGESTPKLRGRIEHAIEQGLLEAFPDPSTAQPQQNRRVLRSQVERLALQMLQ